VKSLRIAALVAAVMIIGVVAIVTHFGHSAAQPSPAAPIGPRTAAALGMAFAPATSTPGITVPDANRAALAGWPHCTTNGKTSYLKLAWGNSNPPMNQDVFLVPLSCPHGNESSLSGGSTAARPKANFRVAIVSPTGRLLVTIAGVSVDAPPAP
jgi:hypothetical protein